MCQYNSIQSFSSARWIGTKGQTFGMSRGTRKKISFFLGHPNNVSPGILNTELCKRCRPNFLVIFLFWLGIILIFLHNCCSLGPRYYWAFLSVLYLGFQNKQYVLFQTNLLWKVRCGMKYRNWKNRNYSHFSHEISE